MTASVSGLAIHSGVRSTVRLHRADGAVRFRRGGREIPAALEQVVATPRCTVLGSAGVQVALVEHLLAALRTRGFWRGVVIEASADELPILDGSAAPWLEAVAALGEPPPRPAPLRPGRTLHYRHEASSVTLEPGEERLCVAVDYPHPAIGAQSWCGGPDAFADLLDARTFGFLDEAEALHRAGLATGASLENAIVFDDRGPLRPLRHADEPARHKALDAVGDLFLLGRPLQARVHIARGSHGVHVSFMRQLLQSTPLPSGCAS